MKKLFQTVKDHVQVVLLLSRLVEHPVSRGTVVFGIFYVFGVSVVSLSVSNKRQKV